MNAGLKMAMVCVTGAMFVTGCGRISDSFKTSIVEFLGVAGELNAQTEAGVSQSDFSQALIKVKSKHEILCGMWPDGFLPVAKFTSTSFP